VAKPDARYRTAAGTRQSVVKRRVP